jgi:hypothetical protein
MKIGIGTLIFLMNTGTQPKQDVQSCFDCVRSDDRSRSLGTGRFFWCRLLVIQIFVVDHGVEHEKK